MKCNHKWKIFGGGNRKANRKLIQQEVFLCEKLGCSDMKIVIYNEDGSINKSHIVDGSKNFVNPLYSAPK